MDLNKFILNFSKKNSKLLGNIEASIVMPFFNQEAILIRNLSSLISNISCSVEIILIDDGSSDKSLKKLINFLRDFEIEETKISQILVFKTKYSQFETACDYFGIQTARAEYVIEIQADIEIKQKGFDASLIKAIRSFNDILMLSGRGTEPLNKIINYYKSTLGSDKTGQNRSISRLAISLFMSQIKQLFSKNSKVIKITDTPKYNKKTQSQIFPSDKDFKKTGYAGKINNLIEVEYEKNFPKNKIWLSETIMRGPIIFDKNKYLSSGGLDIHAFFQGFDEHELALRSFQKKKYRCGFYPIEFSSPLSDGTTRKKRKLIQALLIFFNTVRINKRQSKNFLSAGNYELTSNEIIREIRTF